MDNYFDTDKIMAVLKDYHTVTHIRIALLNNDYIDIAGYPNKKASLCEYIRTSGKADLKCQECDRKACAIARDTKSAYMYQCHAGLYEIIKPLRVNGLVVGYLFFAHMLSGPTYDYCLKEILSRVRTYDLDEEKIRKLVYDSTLLNPEYIKASSRLLEAIATNICMDNMGLLKPQDNLLNEITNYINTHISDDIQIKDICREIGIGKTKLCNLSKKFYKIGIHDYIRNLKIQKAKEMMINDQWASIDEIALKCGFYDYNYFIYIFRKVVGITPKKFIKKYQNSGSQNLSSFL